MIRGSHVLFVYFVTDMAWISDREGMALWYGKSHAFLWKHVSVYHNYADTDLLSLLFMEFLESS